MFAVGRQLRGMVGERDDDRERIAELVGVIAHGDHVFLTRQSSQVSVQHEQHRRAAMIAEPPRRRLVIDERDVGDEIPLVDHGDGVHLRSRRASSMPRWKVG